MRRWRRALRSIRRDAGLYRRGSVLVTVVAEEEEEVLLPGGAKLLKAKGSLKVLQLPEPVLSARLTTVADYQKEAKPKGKKGGPPVLVDIDPPGWVVSAVARIGHYPGIREIKSIAECPFPRPDGTLVTTPGFDRATGTYYQPTIAFPPIPDEPAHEDARAAVERLIAPFRHFPFQTPADAAAFLAGLVGAVARPGIPGPVPGLAVSGNKAGTGKGLLVHSIGTIATGKVVPVTMYPTGRNRDEEMVKVLTALALRGGPLVLFDDLNDGAIYGDGPLDSAMTALTIENRILGTSNTTASLPLRPSWSCTGINILPGRTAYRRWLRCNLVTAEEFPERRILPDLLGDLLARRGDLVGDILTILRAHQLAGHPREGLDALGNFEDWNRIVRAAIHWATGEDCCATQKDAAEENPERRRQLCLMDGWRLLPGGTVGGVTPRDAVAKVLKDPDGHKVLHTAMLEYGFEGEPVTSKALGNVLRGLKDSNIGGWMFQANTKHTNDGIRWVVVRAERKSESGESSEPFSPVARVRYFRQLSEGQLSEDELNQPGGELTHQTHRTHSRRILSLMARFPLTFVRPRRAIVVSGRSSARPVCFAHLRRNETMGQCSRLKRLRRAGELPVPGPKRFIPEFDPMQFRNAPAVMHEVYCPRTRGGHCSCGAVARALNGRLPEGRR